jgi:mono/diheme cytochrome c family protein
MSSERVSIMERLAAATVLLWLQATCVALAQPTGAPSTARGAFSAEQAKNGERQYQSKCASCHGADLHSTEPEAPDLTEGAFKFGWEGKTIANRYEAIRNAMPPGQSKSLDDQTYLDIVTYILQANGIPAGNQKLTPDLKVLEQIVITAP